MAGFIRYRCTSCGHELEEHRGLPAILPDGSEGSMDRCYCSQCRAMVEVGYMDVRRLDPELHSLNSGNLGRILDYLHEHGSISLVGAAPVQATNITLPTPAKLPRICRPLVQGGIVEVDDVEVRLSHAGRARLHRYRVDSRSCPQCGHDVRGSRKDLRCPCCRDGRLDSHSVGRLMVTSPEDMSGRDLTCPKSAVLLPAEYCPATIRRVMGLATLPDPPSGWSSRLTFLPSFHQEVVITVSRSGGDSELSLATMQTSLWRYGDYLRMRTTGTWPAAEPAPRPPTRWMESRAVPSVSWDEFWNDLEGVTLAELRTAREQSGIDGMTVEFEVADECAGVLSGRVWSPTNPQRPADKLVRAIYELADRTLQDPPSIRSLEVLHGYLRAGLQVKEIPGPPLQLRFFGRLSSTDHAELGALLARIACDVPVLMDFSDFEGMGTLLYPAFQSFLQRPGATAWWAKGRGRVQLLQLGVAQDKVHDEQEDAIRGLTTS